MITIIRASETIPLYGIAPSTEVFWLTDDFGNPSYDVESKIAGNKPVNFGRRSVLGDREVVHVNMDGVILPQLKDVSASSMAFYAKCWVPDDGSLAWRPLPGKANYLYQLIRNPVELTVTPTPGITVIRTWCFIRAGWGNVVSPPPYGWRPHSATASYVILCRRTSGGGLYFKVTTKGLDYLGNALSSKLVNVPPQPSMFQNIFLSSLTTSAPEYSWMTPSPMRVSANSVEPNLGHLLASGISLLNMERTRADRFKLAEKESNCSLSICDQAKNADINSIAYLADIVKLITDIKSGSGLGTIQQLLGSKGAKELLRNSSSTFLSGKYGLSLTVADTKKLVAAVAREASSLYKYRVARASFTEVFATNNRTFGSDLTVEEHFKCVYDPCGTGLRDQLSSLYRWDAALTLENTWDLIPFSFVVDWFAPIGDYLNQYDDGILARMLPIKDVLQSTKYTISIPSKSLTQHHNCCGFVTCSEYVRSIRSTLPPIIPFYSGSKGFHNTLEFGAIIIQQLLK